MLTDLKELYRYRDLLVSLMVRDIKVRYRQTFFGMAWAVLQPLAFMLIFTLVFAKFGRVNSGDVPYPIFSYAGLVPWTFFATALGLAVNSIAVHMSMVKKIYFPREVFPLAVIGGCFVDFLIAGSLVGVLMLWYKIPLTAQVVWLPWLVLLELGFLAALSLFGAALNVFYRDVKYIVPLAVQLGLFVTPVIYSASMVPERYQHLYFLNPMAVVVDGFRQVLLYDQPPALPYLYGATGMVALMLVLSYVFFKRSELNFADLI